MSIRPSHSHFYLFYLSICSACLCFEL